MIRALHHTLLLWLFVSPGMLVAEEFVNRNGETRAQSNDGGVLVIEFGEPSPPGSKLGDAIAQAQREIGKLEPLAVPDERALAALLESRAETPIGMIVLIQPRDLEAVAKLPALYPDIVFSIIDAPQPIFAANVQSVQFREEDGMFLLGAIASLRSDGRIGILALHDDERHTRLIARFTDGANHIRPHADVHRLTPLREPLAQGSRLSALVANEFQRGTAIIFSVDDEIIEQALRSAKAERKMVVSTNKPPLGTDSSRLLTHLVKRYDLALLDVLRIFQHRQWHAGTIELGLSGGYVDYLLNADNVEIFPKDSIDRIEAIKDYLGQGVMK